MRVEIKMDETCAEPYAMIFTAEMSEDIMRLASQLGAEKRAKYLVGFREESMTLIEPAELMRVFCANQKVFAVTAKGEYLLRRRLYEVEEQLSRTDFVRISHSEMINLKQVEKFDFSFNGTICAKLKNGESVFASRRYVDKIKTALGL